MRNIEPILKYKTIKSSDESDLDSDVNTYLKRGWKLRGNVFISREVSRYNSDYYFYYNQTITKELR